MEQRRDPDITTHLPARRPTHMSKVNMCVRGHESTDRHDEWPRVPTRRRAHKLAQKRERKVMCGQPLLITATQRIPFTHCDHLLCLIVTYHNNHCNTTFVRMRVCEHFAYECASAASPRTQSRDCICERACRSASVNVNVI